MTEGFDEFVVERLRRHEALSERELEGLRRALLDRGLLGTDPLTAERRRFGRTMDGLKREGLAFQPGDEFERYRIEALLGRGGMAVVYKARRPGAKGSVAIKILRPDLASDPGFRERFERESRILERLHHRHIANVLRSGVWKGHFHFLMNYVPGPSLEMIRRRSPGGALDLGVALFLTRHVAAALMFARRFGLVHRDIKPANVLVHPGPPSRGGAPEAPPLVLFGHAHVRYHAVLADFGVARLLTDPGSTETGRILGTPGFMSPAQAAGCPPDPRDDLWAVGATLCWLLTGKPPGTPAERTAALPDLALPIVQRCLEPDPARRYRHAGALHLDVREALEVWVDRRRWEERRAMEARRAVEMQEVFWKQWRRMRDAQAARDVARRLADR